jgi:hypothetical protein
MLRIRIIAVAATAVTSVLTANGTFAQATSGAQASTPLLIQLITGENSAAPAQASSTTGARKTRLRRSARRKHGDAAVARETDQHIDSAAPSADPVQSNVSADDAPAVDAAPASAASVSATGPTPETDQAQQDDAALPSAVVINGRTVPIAAADQINALDLAADDPPSMQSTLPPGDAADSAAGGAIASRAAYVVQAPAATDESTNNATSDAPGSAAQDSGMQDLGTQDLGTQDSEAQVTSAAEMSAQDFVAKDGADQNADAQNSDAAVSLGRTAQALAALGGALAAGLLAWFLIGAGPVRTYR